MPAIHQGTAPPRLAVLSLVGWLGLTQVAGAHQLQLLLNPPTERPLTEHLRRVRLERDERGQVRSESLEVRLRVSAYRTTTGFRFQREPLALTYSRDGKQAGHLLAGLFRGIVVTEETDTNGRHVWIRGFEPLAHRIARLLPGMDCEKTLVAQQLAGWNQRVASLAGQWVARGDTTITRQPYPLPGGRTDWYYSATKFGDAVPCGDRSCLKLEFAFHSDPARLGAAISDLPDLAGSAVHRRPVEVSGGGHRVIDPETMLIYSEHLTRHLQMTGIGPGGRPTRRSVTEHSEYSWR